MLAQEDKDLLRWYLLAQDGLFDATTQEEEKYYYEQMSRLEAEIHVKQLEGFLHGE